MLIKITGFLNYIEANFRGADYICSDIHGHFSLLETQLKKIDFDPDKDRLFSLGDLIDRGDESRDVLHWLEKPWFFAIQGNHERMLINAVRGQNNYARTQWFGWGGDWAEDMDEEQLLQYCEVLEKLPLAIELEVSDGRRVALVHASLPKNADWEDIKIHLQTLCIDQINSDRLANEMLWGRLLGSSDVTGSPLLYVENISHVFHGHTIVDDYTTHGNRTYMDLGSYSTGHIGILNPQHHLNSKKVNR